MRNPRERSEDTLEAITAIERHARVEKMDLERNELLQVWFLHHLQILGKPPGRYLKKYDPWLPRYLRSLRLL